MSATSGSGPLPDEVGHHHHRRRRHHHRALQITAVHVTVYLPDQSLGPATNDSYSLVVAAPAIKLHAVSVYGALHGLESLAQLMRRRPCDGLCGAEASSEGPEQEGEADVPNGHRHHSQKRHRRRTTLILGVQETVIHDAPRFPHRGLLIDTARHFLSMDTIKVCCCGGGAAGLRRDQGLVASMLQSQCGCSAACVLDFACGCTVSMLCCGTFGEAESLH